ncbi:MAG TPA: vitamin B12-dependent ribonucleotide reductase [Candidatus Eisenbacteria bacterium]
MAKKPAKSIDARPVGTATPAIRSEAAGRRPAPRATRSPNGSGSGHHGLRFDRRNSRPDVNPFEELEWDLRTAAISSEKGELIFEQKDVEIPKNWSMMATNVVVSKYFRGNLGTPEREKSVRQLIGRVVNTITRWGSKDGYFASDEDQAAFRDELAHLLLHQKMAFNSPVWFNCGVEDKPQCSACFINSVDDTMASIMDLAKTEGMLFKWGSGTGTNLSPIRSSREKLKGGGTASGPVSFMKGYDAFAGVIKSGGKTRRAAKMVILNADHPDIVDFIRCKELEEKKAWALIDAGYESSFNGEAYASVFFQNSNNSVRVTDEFMDAVEKDKEWRTRAVTSREVMDTYKARDIMGMITESAWLCGDPGLQFDTTINRWHTCPNTAPINASNPCSEYMFLDDSACNLASLNLMKFRRADGEFDAEAFQHAVDISITAQEIIVANASYPTPAIEKNSHDYRPLGLGYANLGALLMARGVPYDSDAGRAVAGAITSLMHGQAYATSARIAAQLGPFAGYERNREPMLGVIDMHKGSVQGIDPTLVAGDLMGAVRETWARARTLGGEYGYRNSQVTVLAPTGTIGFMMDCDTTGVEPEIAIVKYKKLVGGGMLKIVNQTVPEALSRLGYSSIEIKKIVEYINENETIEGAPGLRDEHLAVFDCAFRPAKGSRSIHYRGHIRMMAAVQPFLSGAISKTVNMPGEATREEIAETYLEAWKLGLKAIAIYRDGCKRSQPVNTGLDKDDAAAAKLFPVGPHRRRLPDERRSITHKYSVGGHEGYITVGMYDDGSPGEIFLNMAKEGSVVSGLMDSFATAISLSLQYGVPIRDLVNKFSHVRYEPSGYTRNPEIPLAKSITDYIFRWLASRFLSPEEAIDLGVQKAITDNGLTAPDTSSTERVINLAGPVVQSAPTAGRARGADDPSLTFDNQSDAPPCSECGSTLIRSGACYKCVNCGATAGCS